MKPVAIVGGGLAGLSAARHLQLHNIPFVLFEATGHLGGLAQSYVDAEGFVYDFGAHFINNRLAATLGVSADCRTVSAYGESVLVNERLYTYPFGLLSNFRYLRDGISAIVRIKTGHQTNGNAASWFRSQYGESMANEVALPLLEAWSGVPADELASSVASKLRLTMAYTMYLKGMSHVTRRAVGIGYSHVLKECPSVYHVYPLGGIARVCQSLAAPLKTHIRLESPVEKIWVDQGRVRAIYAGGTNTEVSAVISTAPVPVLARSISGDTSLEPMREFLFRPMISVNLRYFQRPILPDTVLWTPDARFPFFRITETTRSMPWLAPSQATILTCDIGDEVGGPYWKMGNEELGQLCAGFVAEIFPKTSHQYSGCRVIRIPNAYPKFLKRYEPARQRLNQGTGIEGLYSIGRNGEFDHILMEDVYWRTIRKTNHLISSLAQSNN